MATRPPPLPLLPPLQPKRLLLLLSLLLVAPPRGALAQLRLLGVPNASFPVNYTEGTVPSLLCAACGLSFGAPGPGFDNAERFASGALRLTVDAADYQPGVDTLGGAYLSLQYDFHPGNDLGDDDFAPNAAANALLAPGELSVTWPEAARLRSAETLAAALRAVTFQARGRDPTDKGRSLLRSVRVRVDDPVGGAWAQADLAVRIVGRNDAPVLPSAVRADASANCTRGTALMAST